MNLKESGIKSANPIGILYGRESTLIDRQRLTLLLYCYLPIMLIGVVANFLGVTEPSALFFKYTHSLFLLVAIASFWMYCKRRIGIGVCLSAFAIIGQIIISIEMIYCAYHVTPYYMMLIMANMVLLTMNTMASIAASMKKNTIILGVATIAIYIVCSFLSGDSVMKSFIVIFIIAFVFVSMIGVWMAKCINKMERDNEQLKKEEMELLHILQLKKDEVKVFVSLASEKHLNDGTRVLMERLDERTKRNLLSNVEDYILSRKTDLDIIAVSFPEFTPSERDICRLILQGKKLNDICLALNKNESNINSQRANMRRKLELKSSDNLFEALQKRLGGNR